jgi:hypothetical protein
MRFPWRSKQVSNIFLAVPDTVQYCPQCADVFGIAKGDTKRCGCANSEGVEPYQGDVDYGFEICRYCQAEVISTGSRWSTFFCEHCRPLVLQINDSLDARGLVSLPIGRHSLMHGHWLHARPFTTAEIVADWSAARLDQAGRSTAEGSSPFPGPGSASTSVRSERASTTMRYNRSRRWFRTPSQTSSWLPSATLM